MVEQEIIQSLRTSPEVREITTHVEVDLATERVSAVEGTNDILETFAHIFRHPSHELAGG